MLQYKHTYITYILKMQITKIDYVLQRFCFTIVKFRTCDYTLQFVLIQMEFRFIHFLPFYCMFLITSVS